MKRKFILLLIICFLFIGCPRKGFVKSEGNIVSFSLPPGVKVKTAEGVEIESGSEDGVIGEATKGANELIKKVGVLELLK